MSDLNDFNFKGLSDDAELDALLESVRRDIGEASPAKPQRDTRPQSTSEPAASTPRQPAAAAPRQAAPTAQPRPQQRSAQPLPQQRPASAKKATATATVERELPPQRERIRVVHPEEEENQEKEHKSRFGLALIIFTVILALILAAGCVVLWFYLEAFESTRPTETMNEFTELADENYWSDAVSSAFTVGTTPFEDRDELMDELCMDVLRSNPLVYREDTGWSEDNMVYVVSAGDTDVCRVTLDQAEGDNSAGFGFTYLQVTRVELLASFTAPEAHSITITAPADSAVTINGVAVSADYADSGAEVTASDLGELEEGIADKLYTVYSVDGLYAPVDVYCTDADGEAYAVDGEVGTDSVAFALGAGELEYRILAPKDSTVTVNGVELDSSYDTGETATPAFLEGYDDYGTLPELEVWVVDGLHIQPEVTVEDADGNDLGEPAVDGTELTFMEEGDRTLSDEHSADAEKFTNAYADYIIGEAASEDDLTALQDMVLDDSALDKAIAALEVEADGRTVEHVYVRDESFRSIGSTCFVCTVDVEYSVPAEEEGAEPTTENVAYTIVYVMKGGAWYASSIVS